MASRTNSLARSCMAAVLDESGQPRKAFAYDCGQDETQFSKGLSGAQAFDIGHLDSMPPAIALAWVQRYAEAKFGARVLMPQPEELFQKLLNEVTDLTNQVRALHVVRDLSQKRSA